jgi:hypothetical protein
MRSQMRHQLSPSSSLASLADRLFYHLSVCPSYSFTCQSLRLVTYDLIVINLEHLDEDLPRYTGSTYSHTMDDKSDSSENLYDTPLRKRDDGQGNNTTLFPERKTLSRKWNRDRSEPSPVESDRSKNPKKVQFSRFVKRSAPTIERQRDEKPTYRCPLCPEQNRTSFGARADLEGHVFESHHQKYDFSCPREDWKGHTKDELQEHWKSAHPDVTLPSATAVELHKIKRSAPPTCCICSTPVFSWDKWTYCLLRHCKKDRGNSNSASLSQAPQPIERVETATTEDRELGYTTDSEDEVLPLTVMDLNDSDILDGYLLSSDFVSSFATTLVCKVVPERFDHESMEAFLWALPDTLLDFVDKVACNGVGICKRIADKVWQKLRYVLQS